MAKFFEAWTKFTRDQAMISAAAEGIITLPITSSGTAMFGVWGGDPRGGLLKIIVYRGGTANGQAYSGGAIVNEGPRPAVQVKELVEYANADSRLYQATGLRPGDAIYGATKAGLHDLGPLTVTQVTGTASGVMRDWANRLRADPSYRPSERFLCPLATPYLALTKNGVAATALSDSLVGGPMSAVHGLSIHTTGGGGNRDAFGTAIYGCVNTWNANYEASGFIAAAHFAISWDGVIVQIVPTNRIAWAQGNPGDFNWISVEIDNDGSSKMSITALMSARILFRWICETYGVPQRLAMGTLFYKKGKPTTSKALDDLTTEVCAKGGAPTTTKPFEATFARGLSCHLWLDARNSKPCPGAGILSQMLEIARPVW